MTYTLDYIAKFGLWCLQVNNLRARFYTTRWPAEKVIARYRRMLESEQARYDNAHKGEL